MHYLPRSSEAEAFRALRTHLGNIHNGSTATTGRLIQLVSPSEDEGKTTVTSNLAFSVAQLGKKVLVIDADLRHGTLHEIFDVLSSKGLTSVLSEGVSIDEAIKRSPLASVDVLPRGPEVDNPVELLSKPEFSETLSSLRDRYDMILVDTPALLMFTDASVVGQKTDGVLLNLAIGQSSREGVVRAYELLQNNHTNVLGLVVNRTGVGNSNGYDA